MNNKSIDAINDISIQKQKDFSKQFFKKSQDEKIQEHNILKHRYPYFGNVETIVDGYQISLFSVNDDVVAWNLFWLGEYEKTLIDEWVNILNSDQDGICLDIGSYTGYYSLIAGKFGRKSHAFEIVPRTVERLKINVILNQLQDLVTIHGYGVSNRTHSVSLNMPRKADFLGTGNSIDKKLNVEKVDTTICMVRDFSNIDTGNDKIVGIKIDVEGHEFNVLESIESILKMYKPSIIIEVMPETKDQCFELLTKIGYRIKQLKGLNYLAKLY